MQEPLQTKRSRFVERWSSAEMISAKLILMVTIMSFVIISLIVAVIYLSLRPRPIYYVPGTISPGVAYPQTDRKMTVSMFTASWVLNWCNFTSANVENVYKHAQQFMSPQLLAQTRVRLKKDVEQIKKK